MTNILLVQAAHRTPPGSSARKQSVSDKCFLCESEATATNVLSARQQQMFSVRKQSVSNKAPSRNENQPHVMVMGH
ncbi:hypothetical protein [Lysinibacillus xylanilyticus]|uniref:hypothetical protein n=1 Tax=Lysinibacillus xylanilyticus TaxID=582475 RepID=UPI003D02B9DA